MKFQILFLIWLQACIVSLSFTTSLADPLTNALQSLNIITGYNSDFAYDINGDQRTGLAEVIDQLRIAAGDIILPVASPTLRRTLPASWDEDWFASPVVYDLDNDGKGEIAIAYSNKVVVYKTKLLLPTTGRRSLFTSSQVSAKPSH